MKRNKNTFDEPLDSSDYLDEIKGYFPHVKVIDIYGNEVSEEDDDALIEYEALLRESHSNRVEAQDLLDKLKDREGELKFSKPLKNNGVVRATNKGRLNLY